MPVPGSINDLSTTEASNSPPGGEAVFPLLDNYLRAFGAFIAQLRDLVALKLDTSATTAFTRTLLDDADAAAARTTLDAASRGANTFTGAQTLPGNAVNALEAVPLQQLDDRLRFVSMPPAASTNSFLDFSGLPTWAKRISIQVKDFLTVGNDPLLVQLQGASGGLLSDGYSSTVASVNGFDSSEIFDSTTRIMVPYTWTQAGANRTGIISLTKMSDGSWIIGGCVRANRASDKSVWTLAGVTPVVPGHLAIIRVYTNPESIVGGTVSLLIEG